MNYIIPLNISLWCPAQRDCTLASIMVRKSITVVGAGYTGLTTAAELTLRGFRVNVVAQDLGYRPPLTIVGTQVASSLLMVLLNILSVLLNTF